MATTDERKYSEKPVARYEVAQQSWASGASAAAEATLSDLNGICEQIEVVLNNNTNNVTATVAIASEDSGTLFTKASIAENATTVLKATSDASDFDAFLICGDATVTITPSGDPGTSGLTVDVVVYLR